MYNFKSIRNLMNLFRDTHTKTHESININYIVLEAMKKK